MGGTVLVVGSTGQVGSQIVKILLERGQRVRALIRRPGAKINGAVGDLDYAVGDLGDAESLKRAMEGVDVVMSTANGIIPSGATLPIDKMSNTGYETLIKVAETAGVRRFVQSSVPSHPLERSVPELTGKRHIEARLRSSSIPATIVRNPAFADVWLVMPGARQAMGPDPHATARRPYGFLKTWLRLTGDLVAKRGLLLAPGGADHGSVFVTVHDVAQMLVGVVDREDAFGEIIEAGGPEWVSWREIADLLAKKAKRSVRTLPMNANFAGFGQWVVKPFAPTAANVLGLVRFVATWQPRWNSQPIVQRFGLPPQMTVAEYIDRNWIPT
ncbi:MAG: SDR family oxidoreductase [Geminicoccaceae bacterium]